MPAKEINRAKAQSRKESKRTSCITKEPLINQRNPVIEPQEYFLRMAMPSFRARRSAAITYYGIITLEIATSLRSSQ